MPNRYPPPIDLRPGEYAAHCDRLTWKRHILRTWRQGATRKRALCLIHAGLVRYYERDPTCRLFDSRKIRGGFNELLQRLYRPQMVQELTCSPLAELVLGIGLNEQDSDDDTMAPNSLPAGLTNAGCGRLLGPVLDDERVFGK